MGRNKGVVYSTEHGRMCPDCGKPVSECKCTRKKPASSQRANAQAKAQAPPRDGVVRVGRETKGRKGKGVTLVTGVPLDDAELKDLAKQLKQRCGSGGTVKDGTIEIQGDHRDALVETLSGMGYTVKRTGG